MVRLIIGNTAKLTCGGGDAAVFTCADGEAELILGIEIIDKVDL